jgi:hypothetical protein
MAKNSAPLEAKYLSGGGEIVPRMALMRTRPTGRARRTRTRPVRIEPASGVSVVSVMLLSRPCCRDHVVLTYKRPENFHVDCKSQCQQITLLPVGPAAVPTPKKWRRRVFERALLLFLQLDGVTDRNEHGRTITVYNHCGYNQRSTRRTLR